MRKKAGVIHKLKSSFIEAERKPSKKNDTIWSCRDKVQKEQDTGGVNSDCDIVEAEEEATAKGKSIETISIQAHCYLFLSCHAPTSTKKVASVAFRAVGEEANYADDNEKEDATADDVGRRLNVQQKKNKSTFEH